MLHICTNKDDREVAAIYFKSTLTKIIGSNNYIILQVRTHFCPREPESNEIDVPVDCV